MRRALRCTQYSGFVALGVAMTLTGPLLRAIRAEIPMSYFQAGMVLTGQFVGMIAIFSAGHLADRVGKKPFLMVSGALLALGLGGYAISRSFGLLMASCVVTGIGGGGYEIGINAIEADHAESQSQFESKSGSGQAMNLLHFFYGVGAVAGPLLATCVLQNGLGWRVGFELGALLPLCITLALAFQSIPRTLRTTLEPAGRVYRTGTLWLFAAMLFVYVGIESAIPGWIATFWQELPGHGFLAAPITAALFWGTLTAGRLLCGRLADRIGLVRYLTLVSGGTLVVGVLWTIFPRPIATLAAVVASGGLLAGIYPTAMAYVTGRFPGHSGRVVAFVSVFGSAGGFVLPSLLGWLADSFGIAVLPAFVAALSVLLFAAPRLERPARPS
jgi:fucose permease